MTSFSILRLALGSSLLLLAGNALSGCVSVAAYQKVYLNDEDMKLANKRIEVYETNFQSYREGAGGANGGKVGGGCGCN
ncbi:DUF4266 domain-containing protein [Hymenobacter psychrotolerans]|uniref:DUF4266 domain-containing protein n=1 Tax=Hymenobacter psychrotolerans DSM 18569 TaxID=1121959 RepID=A0A1M6XZC4_9BACT|nr:DUF4266 domain-containing protein [Hymenobacter psychrotolerans]SHL11324.1 protein of unknown function [Hymenobacter psychrotolerans DSM 18569]